MRGEEKKKSLVLRFAEEIALEACFLVKWGYEKVREEERVWGSVGECGCLVLANFGSLANELCIVRQKSRLAGLHRSSLDAAVDLSLTRRDGSQVV